MIPLDMFASLTALLTPGQAGDGMMGGGRWGFGMGLWWLFWIALLVLVVVAIWRLLQRGGGGAERRSGESALEILEQRYARGEIDREEYEEKKRDLGHS